MNFENLNEHSQKIFKRGCIKHIFPRVKESVQKYASHISEAQICLHLVEKWLKDETSVSSEELREAADAAAAWSAWSAAAADAAWSARSAAWSAYAAAYANAAAYADAAVRSAARSAYAADADAWSEAKNDEKEWQQRFFNILLRQQQKMESMANNKIKYKNEVKNYEDKFSFARTILFSYEIGSLKSLYEFELCSLLKDYIKKHRRNQCTI